MASKCTLRAHPDLQFLNREDELSSFFKSDKTSFYQATFYKKRIKQNILVDEQQQSQGGRWSYDVENRKKYPKGKVPPRIQFPSSSNFWDEAVKYTSTHFQKNPGQLSSHRTYSVMHQEAHDWFQAFLIDRFSDFGQYEDAILKGQTSLNHSVAISPSEHGLNIALRGNEHQSFICTATKNLNQFYRGLYQANYWMERICKRNVHMQG